MVPELPYLAGNEFGVGQKRDMMSRYELSQEESISLRGL
ncbi:hypothetical protein MNV_60042 [Candidatus Methanoperedens nitroreducens]|uniref:Uncharacterized protein n=1 Tax=Candidatus Methanoperedens nitratireducens TaxID=1392998 RepID=A0A284VS94_9EURY|nr:hypothetical protein MNV_60042 [Candidatus Methanoperedens nitroreducens]